MNQQVGNTVLGVEAGESHWITHKEHVHPASDPLFWVLTKYIIKSPVKSEKISNLSLLLPEITKFGDNNYFAIACLSHVSKTISSQMTIQPFVWHFSFTDVLTFSIIYGNLCCLNMNLFTTLDKFRHFTLSSLDF